MPALSLVVCLHQEREFLKRLLQNTADLYDDLVVVHDGPDTTGVRQIVERAGGYFFEKPREYQQEPHWPFAWEQAAHDWILRLDADEFPSQQLKIWLQQFRHGPEPQSNISGYTCIWPAWNGRRPLAKNWPSGRNFLFHRQRVRFFGMVEQVPVPDGIYQPLELVLEHKPKRKSHSLRNLLLRKQAYRWRQCIAHSLLGKPTDLFCWRWESEVWPETWEQIRRHPFRTALSRLAIGTLRGLREQWRREKRIFPIAAFSGPLHHVLICLEFWRQNRRHERENKALEPRAVRH